MADHLRLACGEIEQGIGNDAQPPRIRSTCGGDRRIARVGRRRPRLAHQMARAARPLSRRRRVGRSRPEQRDPVDPPPVRRWRARTCSRSRSRRTRRSAASSPSARAGVRSRRLDEHACWSAGSSPRTSTGTASPMPTGTAAASAARSLRRSPDDPRPVNFAFVSCQDVNEGKLNAYRRMIFEDERARARGPARLRPAPRRLHLRGRRISRGSEDPLRPHDLRGRAHSGRRQDRQFPLPLTLDGYRAVYHGYLADPDLQDARARWPFVRCGTITNSPGRAGRAS